MIGPLALGLLTSISIALWTIAIHLGAIRTAITETRNGGGSA